MWTFVRLLVGTPISWHPERDIRTWKGVRCTPHGVVEALHWSSTSLYGKETNSLHGTVVWGALPRSVRYINLCSHSLNGIVSPWQLPSQLEYLMIDGNHFFGTLDFTQLPTNLRHLSLSKNNIQGFMDLTSLPAPLRYLDAHENKFNGPLELRFLPPNLEYLDVRHNLLSGSLNVTLLPPSLVHATFSGNQFDQDIDFVPSLHHRYLIIIALIVCVFALFSCFIALIY